VATSDGFDVVVIGSGPGGYVAAIRAAQLGLKTACVERDRLGGVCLNWGCIPSKALLHNAKLYQELVHGKTWGFEVSGLKVDWTRIIKRSRQVADRLNRGVASLFKKYGVTHVEGTAKLDHPGRVMVGDQRLDAKHVIVATGARPRALPGLAFDAERVMSSKEALVADPMPPRVLIIGGGAIGCEFAYFFNAFGSKVTQVEVLSRLVPVEDEESSEAIERSFKRQGIEVRTGTKAARVELTKTGVRAELERADGTASPEVVEADRCLVAIGIVANTDGMGLEALGVEMDRGLLKVDRDLRTTCPGIYAIGDITAGPALAHKASAQGIHCVERIAGHPGKPVPMDNIPNCTYCEPQVASVGLTEAQCRTAKRDVKIGRFPYSASGKALALEEKEGFVKVIFDAGSGELLGCHIVGHGATELIAEATLARTLEATEAEILGTIHAHPTLAEVFHEAVGQAFGESVNY
jgi:dihydrolipoamide dehydrogenase